MSQQEFEPQAGNEVNRPHYPYNWSKQSSEGMPRDELPGAYQTRSGQRSSQNEEDNQVRVPWWARPQPRQTTSRTFVTIVVLAIVIILLMGALGIMGVIFGSLLHLLGIILGAIFALLLFVFLLVLLILGLIWRALGRAVGYDRRSRRWTRRY